MADTKITALAAIGANPINVATFPIPMVDLLDNSMAASGTTKKVTVNQILGAGGTATLASATISGDLTVDTSTLKVDSANNRVGIGTATPAFTLDVQATVAGAVYGSVANNDTGGSGSARFRVFNSGDVSDGFAIINNYGAAGQINLLNYKASSLALWTNSVERFTISSTGVATWSNVGGVAGTAMTLNSNGLGLGASPNISASGKALTISGAFTRSRLELQNTDGGTAGVTCGTISWFNGSNAIADITGATNSGSATLGSLAFSTGGSPRLTIDSSGNVGIGVTPSYKLDVSTGGVLNTTARLSGNDQSNVRLRFENTGASGRIWEIVGGLAGSNNRWFSLHDVTGSTTPWGVDDSMNVISNVTGTAPTLSTNSQMVFNLTSNTNLRISVRGTDGTTRKVDITLA